MKILMSSRLFYPSLGGSETNAEILAREFTRLGHEVKVITQTSGTNFDVDGLEFPFEVIRKPSPLKLLSLVNWCDAYFHNGIILKDAWPLLIIRRPWIIRHQSWIRSIDGTLTGFGGKSSSLVTRLKHFCIRFSVSISISQAIAEHLHHPSTIIPNPYRDHLFRVIPEISRTKELVFLGRLVSEKGVEVLLKALAQLKESGLKPRLTIIGKGPEESKLRQQVVDLGISEQVVFVGAKVGEELVRMLNEHQIMVIPSLYNEPFGVVALEGIACGCVAVGSEGGGLKDAIGSGGITFPNGDVKALTQILGDLLKHPDKLATYRANAESHLSRHKQAEVAKAYLRVIEAAVQ
ncbi:MAG: glycosyltransferase family 4 protein [Coleofasciculaceae cyanobacterium]